MKKFNIKNVALKVLVTALPLLTFAINISANSVASPTNGQPSAPASLKNHRKF